MKIDFNFAPDTKVTLAADGQTETVDLWARAHRLFEGHAGRVNVFDAALTAPSAGTAVVRADGRTTVSLLEQTGPAEVSAKMDKNRTALIRTPARAHQRGMASGLFYWLAQDKTGRFVVEPGRRHRRVYVSGSSRAMTRAAIAAHAKVAETAVTGAWLAARPQYGGSEAMPLAMAAFDLLKTELWGKGKVPRSDWVMLERGHQYSLLFPLPLNGESELHPMVVDAWGTGARPHITNGTLWIGPSARFLVYRNCRMTKMQPWYCYGVIYENCRFSDEENNVDRAGMVTLRESAFHDIGRSVPVNADGTTWYSHMNRKSGLYGAPCNLMIDSCLVDMVGWRRGFLHSTSKDGAHPPSMYSHGLYLQFGGRDIHARNSVFSQNASQGMQNRSGGQFERNLFLDNNLAAGLHSGTALGTILQFSNAMDLVVFGAGYKRVADGEGAFARGLDVSGKLTAQIGCVVAHLADPENPAEVSTRTSADHAYNASTSYTGNDVQVFNWGKKANEQVAGLDPAVLMQTTIQRFAGAKLGKARATVDELVAFMRDHPGGNAIGATVLEAVRWTKARFGRPILERTAPATLVFRPDPRADGFRWDNRLNWTTQDYPGLSVADAVDLDGHAALFGTLNADIAALTCKGGSVDVTSGRLAIGALGDALRASVRLSGQLWLGATAQPVAIRAGGGRVALTGTVSDLGLEARGNAEVLFGPNATVPAGQRLVLSGQRVTAGWDGTGSATLTVAGILEFRAGLAVTVGGLGYQHQRMELGRRIETASAKATLAECQEHGGSAADRIFLTDLTGTPAMGETFQFGTEIIAENTKNEDVPKLATISAIHSRGIPQLQRFRSGAIGDGLVEPTVAASLVLAAGAQVVIDRRDLLAPGTYDLTGPGVTVTNNGATLPAGVSVTAGKLVLVV